MNTNTIDSTDIYWEFLAEALTSETLRDLEWAASDAKIHLAVISQSITEAAISGELPNECMSKKYAEAKSTVVASRAAYSAAVSQYT